ncbi:HAD superfamily hydrolase (TIGR01509 family) [Pedobacter sp. UYP30]|uniref:HAD family hydrolase n=1 Tax=Pedobacter sp. UYP30 TaxID=1756400 RepID=UPI0033984746
MKTISCLFLDIGGVLLSNGWGHDFRQRAAERFHLDIAEMEKRHKLFFVVYEEGEISLDKYLDWVVFYVGRDFTPSEFRDYMYSLTTPNLEMIAFFKSLKLQYGLKIVAVSNEARELNDYRIHEFKLNNLIDFFVSSCYVHIRKPDVRIFQLAIDMTVVPKDEIVYIDDVQLFVDVAADLGIKSICHKDYLSTSIALADLGLIVT